MSIRFTLDMPLVKNEDAPPYVSDSCMVVCDGLGSGSVRVPYGDGMRTTSYIGSRLVSEAAAGYLEENSERIFASFPEVNPEIAQELKETVLERVGAFATANRVTPDDFCISGGGFRLFPTTLAAISYREDGGKVEAVCFWVGDSRCYCLDPRCGLRQLTRDDICSDNDAMENILRDSPMSQCICTNHDFKVNCVSYTFEEPCVLITASDGCFGYWESPMAFERVLVSPSGPLEEHLRASLEPMRFDDRSMSLAVFGIEDDTGYADAFADRRSYIEREYFAPSETRDGYMRALEEYRAAKQAGTEGDVLTALRQSFSEARDALNIMNTGLWKVYSGTYSSLIAPSEEDEHDTVEPAAAVAAGNIGVTGTLSGTGQTAESEHGTDDTPGRSDEEKPVPGPEETVQAVLEHVCEPSAPDVEIERRKEPKPIGTETGPAGTEMEPGAVDQRERKAPSRIPLKDMTDEYRRLLPEFLMVNECYRSVPPNKKAFELWKQKKTELRVIGREISITISGIRAQFMDVHARRKVSLEADTCGGGDPSSLLAFLTGRRFYELCRYTCLEPVIEADMTKNMLFILFCQERYRQIEQEDVLAALGYDRTVSACGTLIHSVTEMHRAGMAHCNIGPWSFRIYSTGSLSYCPSLGGYANSEVCMEPSRMVQCFRVDDIMTALVALDMLEGRRTERNSVGRLKEIAADRTPASPEVAVLRDVVRGEKTLQAAARVFRGRRTSGGRRIATR